MLHFFVSLAYLYYESYFSRGNDMGRIAVFTIVMLCCVIAGWGQSYYEASGQTSVFTLANGAHSGWSAIHGGIQTQHGSQDGIHIAAAQRSIIIKISSQRTPTTDIAIYDMAGRLAYRQRGFHGSALLLDSRSFAPGVYNTVVLFDGQTYSRRIIVSR